MENNSDIIREIEIRRAHRALDERKIPGDVLRRVMQAAVMAPSCFNNQPWRFAVITGEKELDLVREGLSNGNYWAKKSPCVVLVATKDDLDCRLSDNRNYALLDAGLAVENLVLQAVREGLIAHPIAGFKPEQLKSTFSIPEEYTLITLVVLGYPGDQASLSENHRQAETAGRVRKPEDEVISYNGWNFKTD